MKGDGINGEDEYNDWGIPTHCMETAFDHSFNFDGSSFLAMERNLRRRLVLESLFISMEKNSCNTKEGKKVGEVWSVVLDDFKKLGYFDRKKPNEKIQT